MDYSDPVHVFAMFTGINICKIKFLIIYFLKRNQFSLFLLFLLLLLIYN